MMHMGNRIIRSSSGQVGALVQLQGRALTREKQSLLQGQTYVPGQQRHTAVRQHHAQKVRQRRAGPSGQITDKTDCARAPV